jgi:hypothetical protein
MKQIKVPGMTKWHRLIINTRQQKEKTNESNKLR